MTDNFTKGNWEHVGIVGVDAGHVVVCDATEQSCQAIVKAWADADFHTVDGVASISAEVRSDTFRGVICSSSGADGNYDVYVRREYYGDSPTVTGLFIDFTLRD
jgi:hypothetical protein